MATDVQIDQRGQSLEYGEPVQPGPGFGDDGLRGRVTRQVGLAPTQQVGFDPTPPPPIIQGSPEIVVTRNAGPHVRGRFDATGTLIADSRADDGTVIYADSGVAGSGEANQPPGLARTNAPIAPRSSTFGEMAAIEQRAAIKAQAEAMGFVVSDGPGVPPVAGVVASDAGSNDPRDMGSAPMILSASALPVIRKAPIVPVVITASSTVRAKNAAANRNVVRVKKGKR